MKNNTFTYTFQNGLRLCYIHKPKFKESYVGIGAHYGSRDLIFKLGNTTYTSSKGMAHFIEHTLFQMPDGDAFAKFSLLHAYANAYTDAEKTIYYFTTTMKIYEPLRLLLEMYFTPYFLKKNIKREKNIIASEIKMHKDDIESLFFYKTLQALYPHSSLADDPTGTLESIRQIEVADLYHAYQAFYTTDNSYLVIVSNEPKENVIPFIEGILENLTCKRGIPDRKEFSFSPIKNKLKVEKCKTEQETAYLGIRLGSSISNPMLCTYLIGILDCVLSPVAHFYKYLHEKNAFYADIEYSVSSLRDTSYCIISTTSKYPKLFLKEVETKLKALTSEDLDEKIIELYRKHLVSKRIMLEDEIATLGEETLVYALEGNSYYKASLSCLSLRKKDLIPYLTLFHTGEYVKISFEKSEK